MHSTSKFSTRRVCLTNLSFLVDVVFCFVLFFVFFFLALSLEENFSKLCFWKNKASIFVPKSVCKLRYFENLKFGVYTDEA